MAEEYKSRVLFWNCCGGIPSKKQAIESIIEKYHPELFFICEAEITNDTQNWAAIEGYNTILSPTIHWGKSRLVCLQNMNSSLKVNHSILKDDNTTEMIAFENHDTRIVGLYRPFKLLESQTKKSAIDKLFDHLISICQTSKKTLGGWRF